ncbi:hypothetical protein QVD17_11943 [Tagetes erecta]|uniref:Uncharacterized protein n=1 Tax=Tagetes erecta TaxID=13708 RepID=A0AAD8KUC6_TARER|nr:hypothetical protein QVD17_11943 [Tagetes erecta]
MLCCKIDHIYIDHNYHLHFTFALACEKFDCSSLKNYMCVLYNLNNKMQLLFFEKATNYVLYVLRSSIHWKDKWVGRNW